MYVYIYICMYIMGGGRGGLGVLDHPQLLSEGCLAPPLYTNYYVTDIT